MIDTFANRLKTAMTEKNMKLTKLSNITGISKPLISNYLSGNYEAKQQNIYKLAMALEVTPAWLMGYDVDINDTNITENDFVVVEENVGRFKIGQIIKGNDIAEYTKDLLALLSKERVLLSKERKEVLELYVTFLCFLKELYDEKKITKDEYEKQKNEYIEDLLSNKYISVEQYKVLKQQFD